MAIQKHDKTEVDRDIPSASRSIKDRIQGLIGNRSIRQAATDWGLEVGTLNGYIYRSSIPPIDKALSIARAEGVTIEWLVTGEGNDIPSTIKTEMPSTPDAPEPAPSPNKIGIKEELAALLNGANPDDLETLKNMIIKRGLDSLLISEKAYSIAAMIDDLPDEALKEISLLLNYAQFCVLTGREFKASYITEELRKIAS